MNAYASGNLRTGNSKTIQTDGAFSASYIYDANGNIETLKREMSGGPFDYQKCYNYYGTGRLDCIADAAHSNDNNSDRDNQSEGNYKYDEIENINS